MKWNDRGVLNSTAAYQSDDDGDDDTTHPEAYSTALLGNRSVAFIDFALQAQQLAAAGVMGGAGVSNEASASVSASAAAARPFFVIVAPHAPHVPATPAAWHLDLVPEQPLDEVETMGYDQGPAG
jgi:hypothetical protein